MNKHYALSFLTLTSSLQEYPESFLAAFVKVITAIGLKKLPPHLLAEFIPFLKQFRPTQVHTVADLSTLYEFTKMVGSEWEWLSYSNDRVTIIADASTLILPESGAIVSDFANEHQLYSSCFFKTFEHLMSHKSL